MSIKIGLIGAGKRQRTFYVPVIKKLGDIFSFSGVTNRTKEKGESLASDLGCKFYNNAKDLVEKESPDFLIVCVKHNATYEVLESLSGLDIPLLIETPVEDRRIVDFGERYGSEISVAEQWPYLPIEQFKNELYLNKIIDRPMLVMNDGRSFDYHAIAQLRTYIGRSHVPVIATGQIATMNKMIDFIDNDGKESVMQDSWELGNVTFNNGSVISHQFSYMCKKAPFRTIQSLRGYSRNGTILSGKIDDKNNDYEILDFRRLYDNRKSEKMNIIVERAGLVTKSITDEKSGMMWVNRFSDSGLDDQETAIATHLLSIGNGECLYSPRDSLIDSIVMSGIKQACHTRSTVSFS